MEKYGQGIQPDLFEVCSITNASNVVYGIINKTGDICMLIRVLFKKLYMAIYRIKNKSVICEQGVEFGPNCIFEGKNYLSKETYLYKTKMGTGSYSGIKCFLQNVKIGRYTCIGPNVNIVIGRHPTREFVSVYPAFYSTNHTIGFSYVDNDKFDEIHYAIDDGTEKYAVEIGNDVWIGAGVTIVDGVKIGDGAIVGACSLVLEDVAPYSIVVGTPAREICKRFSDEDIEYLERIKWWNQSETWIKKYSGAFENIAVFRGCMEKSEII